MNDTRKRFPITLASLAVVLAAGCSSSATQEQSAPSQPAPSTSSGAEKPAEEKPAAPAKITIMGTDNTQPYPTSNTMNDPYFKYLGEKTNTEIVGQFLPHGNYADQLRINLAGGAKPDVIVEWTIAAVEDVLGELPLPLNDLIDQYGPNLKKVIPQSAWDAVTRDGKIYAIPKTSTFGSTGSERVIYVREDWMKAVGFTEPPKTSDEFLDLLRAFRDQDPAGGGQTIPFSIRENITWGENIFGMFGFDHRFYSYVDGEYIPNIIHPKMKEALAFWKTMVDEKLIDSEFLTLKGANWKQKIVSNRTGAFIHQAKEDWTKNLIEANPDRNDPNAKFVAIPTPRAPGVTGPVGNTEQPTAGVFVVTKYAKDPAAVVRLFDFMASEEGMALTHLGVPELQHKKNADGSYELNREEDAKYDNSKYRSSFYQVAASENILKALYSHNPESLARLQVQNELAAKEGFKNYFEPLFPSQKTNPDLQHGGTMFKEMFTQIVYGKQPLDYFDKFVEDWKKQGGAGVIKEATEWYQQNRQ